MTKINPNRKVTMRFRDIQKLKQEATATAVQITNLFPLIVLRDEFGFGKVRLERYMEKYNEVIEAYNEDYITLEDVAETIEQETGISIAKGE